MLHAAGEIKQLWTGSVERLGDSEFPKIDPFARGSPGGRCCLGNGLMDCMTIRQDFDPVTMLRVARFAWDAVDFHERIKHFGYSITVEKITLYYVFTALQPSQEATEQAAILCAMMIHRNRE